MEETSLNFSHVRDDIDEVTSEFSIVVPQSEFLKRIDLAVKALLPQVVIKGFRKGKAPASMVKKLHGERVRSEVAERLVSETLYEALKKESIEETVGEPEFTFNKLVEEQDFSYSVRVFFPPAPKVKKYDKFDVEIEEKTVSDEDIDKSVNELLSSQAKLKDVARKTVKADDIVTGKIVVQLDGEEPGKEEPLVIKVGGGQAPEELEKALIGMKLEEQKDITSTLPEEHQDENLRGKKISYHVTIDKIQEQELPEITDDFVKTLGMGAETALELRLKLRERLEGQAEAAEASAIQAQIFQHLLDNNTFVVPQTMVDSEIKGILVQNRYVDPQKVDVARMDVTQFRESLGEMAEERVRTGVIIAQIAKQEKIEFSDDDAKKVAEELAEEHSLSIEEVTRILFSDGRRESFKRENEFKKVCEFLEKRATVKKVKELKKKAPKKKAAPKKGEKEKGEKKKATEKTTEKTIGKSEKKKTTKNKTAKKDTP